MIVDPASRDLFMKHALPCAGTLVQRGAVEQGRIDELIDAVRFGREVPAGSENIFKVAMAACTLLAKDRGKEIIDQDIIYEYYRHQHDRVIDRRYEEMGDFDPGMCRIRAGVVESLSDDMAIIQNSAGRRAYRMDFVPLLKKGDLVTTHYDFIIEKIDRATAELMVAEKREMGIQ